MNWCHPRQGRTGRSTPGRTLTPAAAPSGTVGRRRPPRPPPDEQHAEALPGEPGLRAERLEQALTNVRKHAPGARVTVRVAYDEAQVRLTIRNTPPAGRAAPWSAPAPAWA
ncbi:hypothetical protein OHB49_05725 [Streptomyces sp. NBC_01717]|uniref:hypothetical protein n=1 Tax=Streptomyces sp. NBC_01717 TaxID=2975918 RepID=UPI002E376758|nr:hypothetical protein [Streptomyces sp. NBC_01717]